VPHRAWSASQHVEQRRGAEGVPLPLHAQVFHRRGDRDLLQRDALLRGAELGDLLDERLLARRGACRARRVGDLGLHASRVERVLALIVVPERVARDGR
jgi:hypothetical protein